MRAEASGIHLMEVGWGNAFLGNLVFLVPELDH